MRFARFLPSTSPTARPRFFAAFLVAVSVCSLFVHGFDGFTARLAWFALGYGLAMHPGLRP